VAAGSTGGTISGISKYLKEQNPNVFSFMPDPFGSIFYDYFRTGEIKLDGSCSYFVEGVGEDHLTKAMNFEMVNDMIQFNDENAFSTARRLAREEGIIGGGTGGANVWAALQLASRLTEPAVIVTVIPDNGAKYLSKMYNDEWMKEHGFSL
jgi:cysteine synthase